MALEFLDHDDLVIQADLPEVDPDRDIEVWISHDVLHIRARAPLGAPERAPESDLRDGSFARDIALPPGTGEADVDATYAGRRLMVRAPLHRAVEHCPRRVPVRRVGRPLSWDGEASWDGEGAQRG